jgi:tRNA threonylcarbamoyladenosine biosynthesis protein TsaE
VIVRAATAADAADIVALTGRAFAGQVLTPPSRALEEDLDAVAADLGTGGGLVAVEGAQVVGAVRFRQEGRTRWLRRLAVDPAHRRRGVGGALVAASAGPGLTALRAGVRHALPANAALFRSWGFELVEAHDFWDALGLPLPRPVPTASDMRRLGNDLAALLRPGDLVLLVGPLGAGKTTLAQGIGAGLGVAERLTSPTFVLAREHAGRMPVVHVDAYRLGSAAELDDLDLDTPAESAVTLVEWGEGLAETLAAGHLRVTLGRSEDAGDDVRTATLVGVGPAWAGRRVALEEL